MSVVRSRHGCISAAFIVSIRISSVSCALYWDEPGEMSGIQPGHDPQERRFAAARRTEDADEVVVVDFVLGDYAIAPGLAEH
jgi:hypothetical protein